MKKHLLLALALLPGALTANAAIDMYMGEQKLDIDGTYTFNTITDYELGGYKIDPGLSVISPEDTEAIITAQCTSGQKIQMCAGGLCITETTVKKTVELKANTALELQFEYLDMSLANPADMPKNITTVITVEDIKAQSYTIVLNADGSGIAAVVDSDSNVAYANGELIYNVSKSDTLTLCDTNGRMVFDAAVSGNGSISLANLAKGIYIYRLGHYAGKILVK